MVRTDSGLGGCDTSAAADSLDADRISGGVASRNRPSGSGAGTSGTGGTIVEMDKSVHPSRDAAKRDVTSRAIAVSTNTTATKVMAAPQANWFASGSPDFAPL